MKKLGKVSSVFSLVVGFAYNLFVVVMILMAGLIVLSSLNTPLKIRLFAVLSGSMEPAIPVGSLVVVLPQQSYSVGDVITVRGEKNPKESVTHRIESINQPNPGTQKQYQLKGDANEEQDRGTIAENRIIGKVFFHVPWLGRIISFAQTQNGFIAMIIVPATILIYSEIVSIKNEVIQVATKGRKRKKDVKIPPQEVVSLINRHQQSRAVTHHHIASHPALIRETQVSIQRPRPIAESPSLRRVTHQVPQQAKKTEIHHQLSHYQKKIQHVLHLPEQGKRIVIGN